MNIKENPNLEALSLPPKNVEETYGHASALVAGYGYNGIRVVSDKDGSKHNEFTSDDRLHWAKTSVLNNTDCQGKHYTTVDDSQMCAQMLKKSLPVYGTCHVSKSHVYTIFDGDIIQKNIIFFIYRVIVVLLSFVDLAKNRKY